MILVFKTKKSVEGLLSGKFTIGADAAAAAGPVGRQAAAATDAHLKAEIYSYSRSRGLFAGVSLDGSVLEIDTIANANFYRDTGISPAGDAIVENPRLPESAAILLTQIAGYSAPRAEGGVIVERPQGPIDLSNDPAIALRGQLAQSSRQLQVLLDEGWQRYLAIPAEVYNGRAHPPPRCPRPHADELRHRGGEPAVPRVDLAGGIQEHALALAAVSGGDEPASAVVAAFAATAAAVGSGLALRAGLLNH